ncbi:xaa-Pro aminopeptidase 1 isoform X1 [Tachysurus ichikawai]
MGGARQVVSESRWAGPGGLCQRVEGWGQAGGVIEPMGGARRVVSESRWAGPGGLCHRANGCSVERDWLNDYHQQCRETVGAELQRQGRKEGLDWLIRETQPIT